LQAQDIGILVQGFGQEGLEVPGVGQDGDIRIETGHCCPISSLNGFAVPVGLVESDLDTRKRQFLADDANLPVVIAGVEVTDVVAGSCEKLSQLERVNNPAPGRRPIEEETDQRYLDKMGVFTL